MIRAQGQRAQPRDRRDHRRGVRQIVDALVNDVIMPIIGISGKADFSNYFMPLSGAVTATNLADARKQGGVLAYGDFITVVINFVIVAVALFVVIKAINSLNRKPPAAQPRRLRRAPKSCC